MSGMFPVELAERCIRLHGLERARLVFDPFSGVGTTAVATMGLGVGSLCVEIDQVYHRAATDALRAAS